MNNIGIGNWIVLGLVAYLVIGMATWAYEIKHTLPECPYGPENCSSGIMLQEINAAYTGVFWPWHFATQTMWHLVP